jgi:hypothetical protein
MQAAGGNTRQAFSVFGNEAHDFPLPIVRRIPESCFAAHFGATCFKRQREMQDAELLLRESRRTLVLATRNLARCGHRGQSAHEDKYHYLTEKIQQAPGRVRRILHDHDSRPRPEIANIAKKNSLKII